MKIIQRIFISVWASCLIFNNPSSSLPSSKSRSAYRRICKAKHILKLPSFFAMCWASLANKISFIHSKEWICFGLSFSDNFQTVGIIDTENSIILKPLKYLGSNWWSLTNRNQELCSLEVNISKKLDLHQPCNLPFNLGVLKMKAGMHLKFAFVPLSEWKHAKLPKDEE